MHAISLNSTVAAVDILIRLVGFPDIEQSITMWRLDQSMVLTSMFDREKQGCNWTVHFVVYIAPENGLFMH